MDPITGQGIGDALRDAELLAAALAGYERARDRAALPMYELTGELASFAPPGPSSRRCSPPWPAGRATSTGSSA